MNEQQPWTDAKINCRVADSAQWLAYINGYYIRLYSARNLIREINNAWQADHDAMQAKLDAANERISEQDKRIAECEQWEDLPDGTYEGRADIDNGCVSESGSITVKGNSISVYEYSFGAEREAHVTIDSIRIQRRKEAQTDE